MTSSASTADRFFDTPTDFEAFVARERGVGREQAAELIVGWLESYESSAPPRSRGASEALPSM